MIFNSNKTLTSNSKKSYDKFSSQSSTFYNKNIKISKLSKYNNLLKIKPSGFNSLLHFGYTNLKQNRTFHKSSVLNFNKPNFFKTIFSTNNIFKKIYTYLKNFIFAKIQNRKYKLNGMYITFVSIFVSKRYARYLQRKEDQKKGIEKSNEWLQNQERFEENLRRQESDNKNNNINNNNNNNNTNNNSDIFNDDDDGGDFGE
uniref:hypothetical protein n=1 Tax=Fuscoporia gilva TaxID=40471 RepID=UPI0023D853C2|nr:hypothetical protein P2X57_mgp11 [Fuscoporia gilva]WDD39654.1 hypothetical protein [Fuscoporia gilva]